MRIGNLEVPGMLALAPMAGVTDLAFRTVCADLGADMTVTEMVSSRALVYQDKKSRGLLKKNDGSVCGAVLNHLDREKFGIPSIMPPFPGLFSEERPGRHNNLIWPFLNGFYMRD